jgi:flagellar hook-associated protein 3
VRVTHKMIADRVTSNLSSSVSRLLWWQNQMSTGRRINRPADDPIGLTRDLSYRTTIQTVEQYQNNISAARTQLNTVEQSLSSINSLLITAREIATSLADGTYDATARAGAAVEARSLFEQILQAGNVQSEGRYLLSGHLTRTQAFLASASGVVYQGDRGAIKAQIESSSQVTVNLIGSDVLLSSLRNLGDGFDLNRGLSATVLLADLHQGAGIDQSPGLLQFTDDNTGATVTVDVSGATTAGDVVNAINAQLAAGGMNGVTAEISPDGKSFRLTAEDNGQISTSTLLANLNNGAAVDLAPGTFRVVTDDLSVDVTIDLSGAATINDAITAFNSQMAAAGVANVTMSVNVGQTGLRIVDANATPLGLRIYDEVGESTARDLGLLGYVNDELVGSDLNPDRQITVTESGAAETTASDLGILGTFTDTKDGGDLDPILALTTPLSELDDTRGINLGRIRISQGSDYAIVDLSSASTVGDVITAINNSGLDVQASLNADSRGIQVVPTIDNMSLKITNEDATGSAERLGIEGSPDILGSMMLLVEALENNDQELVGAVLGSLEKATDHILDQRAAVGANIRRMDATDDRLSDLGLSVSKLLSEVEDADIIKVTTELATQQNAYQAALNATARILTPSLVDFVR